MAARLDHPFYYLENFRLVLHWVAQRYADLLNEQERGFLAAFEAQPRCAQALLVRMVMRQGELFRLDKLVYPEIGDPARALGPLLEQGWVSDQPLLTLHDFFRLYTRPEIVRAWAGRLPPQARTKSQLLAGLSPWHDTVQGLQQWWPEAPAPVVRLCIMPLCQRLRLMYFGNLRQDWSEFVLADLGRYVYETVPFDDQARAWQTRADVDAALRLHDCREQLEAGVAPDLVDAQLATLDNCKHPWLERRRARLLLQLGRQYERLHEWQPALQAYRRSSHPEARVRAVRVLERSGQTASALAWVQAALATPLPERQALQLQRMATRLRPGPRRRAPPAAAGTQRLDLTLPAAAGRVEEQVRQHLSCPEAPVYYVENALIPGLFGLLCWEALFAPLPGAFFHPYQSGPADLGDAQFRQRRALLFQACLDRLADGSYRRIILERHAAKAGVQCVLVSWPVLDRSLVELALHCIPAQHLGLCFERLLADPVHHCAGLPDLIQFWPAQRRYLMVEVKGPGDRLQDSQLGWLGHFEAHGLPAAVCHVRRPGTAACLTG